MALVRFGGGVSEMRGSIAGNVFSRNRSGAIVRNRTKPINQPTQAQSDQRTLFAQAASSYKNLTPAQVNGWEEFSLGVQRLNSLGELYQPQPSQLFIESNLNMLISGVGMISDAPVGKLQVPVPAEMSLDIITTAGVITTMEISSGDAWIDTDFMIVEATLPMPSSRKNRKRYLKQITVAAYSQSLNLLTGYTQRFGANVNATPGVDVIQVRVRGVFQTNGFSSEWVYLNATPSGT